jgi:hypothetical protein
MHQRRRSRLQQLSLSRPTTAQGLQSKARSIGELVRADEPVPIQRMIEELHWLIDLAEYIDNWEARRAAVQASNLLELFDAHISRTEMPYEGDPNDVAPLYGYWPAYEPGDVDDWWELFMIEGSVWYTYGSRDALRRQLFGEPPWIHQPGVPDPEKVGMYQVMLEDVRPTGTAVAFEGFEDD